MDGQLLLRLAVPCAFVLGSNPLACPNPLGASYPKPLFSFALLTVTLTFFLWHHLILMLFWFLLAHCRRQGDRPSLDHGDQPGERVFLPPLYVQPS